MSKGRYDQTSLTIDLGDRRLGVQLGDSLHKGPGKPLLEGETSVKGLEWPRSSEQPSKLCLKTSSSFRASPTLLLGESFPKPS